MYQSGVDVIFHASGGTGAGVFQEAKAINEQLNEADLEDKKFGSSVWIAINKTKENTQLLTAKKITSHWLQH